MGLISKIVKTVKKVVKSPFKAAGSLLKGNIGGAIRYGLIDNALITSGEGTLWKSKMTPTGQEEAAKKLKASSQRIQASSKSTPKGLVNQLRQGRNSGGGSYSDTAKNPLGGSTGKTGSFSGRTG